MNDQELKESKFRESLRDVAAVLAALSPLCRDFKEMEELVGLAAGEEGGAEGNDACLKMLMALVIPDQGPAKPQGRR